MFRSDANNDLIGDEMKIECNGCGKQYEDSYEFCPHCGTRRGDFKLMKYNKELKKKETRNYHADHFLKLSVLSLLTNIPCRIMLRQMVSTD